MAEGKAPEPVKEGIESLDLSPDVIRVLTDYEIHRIEENLSNTKRNLAKVSVGLPLDTLDTDMEAIQAALKPLGELISTLPSPDASREDAIDFDLVVGFKVPLAEAAAALQPLGAKVASLLKAKGGVTADLGRQAPPAPSAGTQAEAAPPAATSGGEPVRAGRPSGGAPDAAPDGSDIRSLTKTIRVELPKLDKLMNLVGELVLTKGRLLALSERLRDQMGFSGEALELTKAQKELERRLGALQEAVMDVRMVPMGQVFSKLHRVMRKILHDVKKEVNLVILGAETQLDKLLVEDVSDPLIHVIRNSVDHGIEDVETRKAAGKKPEGTVVVSAQQRGNYVIIEVSDDGAGIDLERVRAKALKNGLISPDQHIDDRQLLDLLFLPGFSTRDEVTELSGRGVGMDVLRRNIANLSGMIELHTEKGRGTTVRIILPITLAIIQALLVEAAGETYAIPLNSVLETVVIEPENIRSIERRPVLRLREQTLPLVRVASLFNPREEEAPPVFAVIVGIAEKRVAFAVDNLLNQRDVVIKSLGRRLQNLRGISGATDLGDQRTVLILDVAEMIDEVFGMA
jgi:two-component system chemotaxis sensor kinase CheA